MKEKTKTKLHMVAWHCAELGCIALGAVSIFSAVDPNNSALKRTIGALAVVPAWLGLAESSRKALDYEFQLDD